MKFEPRTPKSFQNKIFGENHYKVKTEQKWDYKPKRGPKKKVERPFTFAIIKPAFGKFTYRGNTGTWAETMAAVRADGHTAYRQGNRGNIIHFGKAA